MVCRANPTPGKTPGQADLQKPEVDPLTNPSRIIWGRRGQDQGGFETRSLHIAVRGE